jgi:hypothetical protein
MKYQMLKIAIPTKTRMTKRNGIFIDSYWYNTT